MAKSKLQEGAQAERTAFRKYLNRKKKKDGYAVLSFKELLAWIDGRAKRYNQKKGGLGRK